MNEVKMQRYETLRTKILNDLWDSKPEVYSSLPMFAKTSKLASIVMQMVLEAPIYRIKINENKSVDTDCYDMIENWKSKLKRNYANVDDLPTWVQEKLAVLMTTKPNQADVENIGRRINERVFWVYGRNPREESKEEGPIVT
jgi:hypothetical protein